MRSTIHICMWSRVGTTNVGAAPCHQRYPADWRSRRGTLFHVLLQPCARDMLDSGEIINVQRKKNLRSKYFSPGQKSVSIVEIKGITTGIVICYDIQWKETLRKARDHNAELIIISNADYTDEWDDKYFAYKYLAKQFNAWIVTANRFGIENGTKWDGHIEILNPIGDLVISGKSKEQFIMYCIKINKGQSISKDFIRKVYSRISLGYLILKNIKIVYHYI